MQVADQLRKGTTRLAVLHALERGPLYAYGLRRLTWDKTAGVFNFNEGALYTLLHSLERDRLVSSSVRKVGGRHRRYYRLTARGRDTLARCRHDWKALNKVLDAILD
jgi:PadR family transcriptional regulator, regulatory protein PadR